MNPIYIKDRQGDDATRDAIYLFQTKQWVVLPEITDFGEHGITMSDDYDLTWDDKKDEDGEPLTVTNEELEGMGLQAHVWRTESVFASRQEAKAWGDRRPYAWGLEGEGWRTYSVCAEASLAEFLKERWPEWVSTKPITNEDGGISIPVMVTLKPGDDVIMRAGMDGKLSLLYGAAPTKAMIERHESQKDGRQ